MPGIFQLENVSKNYGYRVLFKNLNFHFQDKAVHCFLGPSGCGKTTLLKLLMKLEIPTDGIVHSPQGFKGVVFQSPQLLSWRTVEENISLPLELQNKNKERIQNLLQTLKLENSELLFPYQLSGGMKMRVSLARALVTRPQILFLDEPLSALDEITRLQLQYEVRSIKEEKELTVFLVTHSFTEAAYMADFVYIFKPSGKIKAIPSPLKSNRTSELRYTDEFQKWVQVLEKELWSE